MRPVSLVVAAALALGGVVALFALLAKHDLGPFSSSPQILEVPLGRQRIAGGGRAVVAVSTVTAEEATLRVSCRDESAEETLAIGRLSDPVCGLSVAYLDRRGTPDDPDDPLRVVFEVIWDE